MTRRYEAMEIFYIVEFLFTIAKHLNPSLESMPAS